MTQRTFGQALGELILRKRRAAGLTQTQLAEDAYSSAAKTRRISELENGTVANPHPKTIDPIITILGITDAEIEECARAAELRLDPDLDRAYREARNLIEVAARQFEHAQPDASLARLEDFLRAKAKEWRLLRQRIAEIEAVDLKIDKLKVDAEAALSAGDFDRVDALLAEAEEEQQQERTIKEVERQAKIRITRGDACLLREDPDSALEFYLTAARYFQPFDEDLTAEMLDALAGRVYEHSLRVLKPRFFIAARLLDELAGLKSVRENALRLGTANYRRGLVYRNEAVRQHAGHIEEQLLERAVEFSRLAAETPTVSGHEDMAVCTRISLANSLMDLAKLKSDPSIIEESVAVLRVAKVIAAEEKDVRVHLPHICNSIGAALMVKRMLIGEEEATKLLDVAFDAFREAIIYGETHCTPDVWGAAKMNCARILAEKASLKDIKDSTRSFLRIQAIAEYAAAIETYPVTLFPDRFAEAHIELGGVLAAHAADGTHTLAEFYLERALMSYQTAAAVLTLEHAPHRWAYIHMRVGAIFAHHAFMEGVESKQDDLQQAINCFNRSAEVFTSIGDEGNAKLCADFIERVEQRNRAESADESADDQ